MRGSITIAVAPLGWKASPTSSSTVSAWSWIAASIVSCRPVPATHRRSSRSEIGWPSASLTSRRSPSRPWSSVLRGVLEAREPVAVGADRAEQLRGEQLCG